MRPRELPEITSLPIFKAVHSPRDRDYLLEKSCLKVVERSEFIFRAGCPSTHLYILLDGYVKLYVDGDRGVRILNVIRPRKPFIIPAVILSERNIPNAIALTSCRVLSFKSSILMEIQQRDLGLSDYLLKQMAKTVRDSIFFQECYRSSNAQQKILAFYKSELGHLLGGILSKKDVASFLGMTPQTYSRLSKK